MRVLNLLVASMMVAAVMAGAGEHETEAEGQMASEVPVLPGLNAGCLPRFEERNYRSPKWKYQGKRVTSFGGKCVSETSCPAGQARDGYCAGVGVVCCKGVAAPVPVHEPHHRHHHRHHEQQIVVEAEEVVREPRHHRHHHRHHDEARRRRHHHRHHSSLYASFTPSTIPPQSPVPAAPQTHTIVLKSGVSQCQTKGGVCKAATACTGTTQSGLCPGAASIKCCFAKAAPATPAKPVTPAAPASAIGAAIVSAANTVCANYHAHKTSYSQPLRKFGLNVAHSDCSSFVQTVFEQAGFSSFWGGRGCAQTSCMRSVITKKGGGYHKNAQLGDIVMWASGSTGHVGIITKVCTPTTYQLTAMGNHGCGPYPLGGGCMTWQQMTAYGEGGAAGFKGYWTPH